MWFLLPRILLEWIRSHSFSRGNITLLHTLQWQWDNEKTKREKLYNTVHSVAYLHFALVCCSFAFLFFGSLWLTTRQKTKNINHFFQFFWSHSLSHGLSSPPVSPCPGHSCSEPYILQPEHPDIETSVCNPFLYSSLLPAQRLYLCLWHFCHITPPLPPLRPHPSHPPTTFSLLTHPTLSLTLLSLFLLPLSQNKMPSVLFSGKKKPLPPAFTPLA